MPRLGKRHQEHLNVRLPNTEMAILKQYCEATQRTQSDVIREFIRSLKATAPVAEENVYAEACELMRR
ncbi:MAG: ribbon-helix-helix protein, CopG family [Leptolyngbya sp. BL-A-14]